MDGLQEAIEWAGGERALGRLIGVSHTTINDWKRRGRVPADGKPNRVLQLEAATPVPRERIRPELYTDGDWVWRSNGEAVE